MGILNLKPILYGKEQLPRNLAALSFLLRKRVHPDSIGFYIPESGLNSPEPAQSFWKIYESMVAGAYVEPRKKE